MKRTSIDKIGEINSLRQAEKTHEQGIRDNLIDLIVTIQESELLGVMRILAENHILDAEWSVANNEWQLTLAILEGLTFVFGSKSGVGVLNPKDGRVSETEIGKFTTATCSALEEALDLTIEMIHESYRAYLQKSSPHLLSILEYPQAK